MNDDGSTAQRKHAQAGDAEGTKAGSRHGYPERHRVWYGQVRIDQVASGFVNIHRLSEDHPERTGPFRNWSHREMNESTW